MILRCVCCGSYSWWYVVQYLLVIGPGFTPRLGATEIHRAYLDQLNYLPTTSTNSIPFQLIMSVIDYFVFHPMRIKKFSYTKY